MEQPREVEKIQRDESLVDLAYTRIREAIITGQIQQGKRLNQLRLTENLGVSQRTVREALTRLVSEGLASHEPRKGIRVISLPFDELEEIYELRALLEGWAVELAVENLTTEDLVEMRRLLQETVPTGQVISIEKTRQANQNFHWIPIEASGRKHLMIILSRLWQMVLISALPEEKDRAQDFESHKELIDALEARKGKKARKIIERHILQTLYLHRQQ